MRKKKDNRRNREIVKESGKEERCIYTGGRKVKGERDCRGKHFTSAMCEGSKRQCLMRPCGKGKTEKTE